MNPNFKKILLKELERVDSSGVSNRFENVIEHFSKDSSKAVIKGSEYTIFNSNDYLGLRFNEKLKKSEAEASEVYGVGPGAVRFISGSLKVYKDLEGEIASFHGREDAIVFSSAFTANLGVIHSLIKGQSKDSLLSSNTLVISDELNHRSIIDSIRVSNLKKENKAIFKHKDLKHLKQILDDNKNKFDRVLVITDGVFSMLGNYQDLKKLKLLLKKFESFYEQGILLIVDDCHGVGCYGINGKGVEEVTGGTADLLIGTFGKAFGVDGGYVVGDKILIDYLRESVATYIYSNPVSPGVAGASLESVKLLKSKEGKGLLKKLRDNITYFKQQVGKTKLSFVIDSDHPIQPLLIGDPIKTKKLVDYLFKNKLLVTNISYPIVPKGKDEIRIQLSASHSKKDIDDLIKKLISF